MHTVTYDMESNSFTVETWIRIWNKGAGIQNNEFIYRKAGASGNARFWLDNLGNINWNINAATYVRPETMTDGIWY